jgi:hypothetical protein
VAGETASVLGKEGGIVAMVVLAVLAAIMAVVIGTGVYLVYEAPVILSEAAFEFIPRTSPAFPNYFYIFKLRTPSAEFDCFGRDNPIRVLKRSQ